MPAAEINRFPQLVDARLAETGDCAIWCLSVYLGVPYTEVLRVVATLDKRNKGRDGLWTRQIKQVAVALGTRLIKRNAVDLESDYGILLLRDHVVVLRNGLIFETTGDIWEAEVYLKHNTRHLPTDGILIDVENT